MNVIVNGERREVAEDVTLGAALRGEGLPRRGVAVAVDGTVVPRASWDETPLGPDAAVEILTAVQGG